MAHPDKTRGGSEQGQRKRAGQTSRQSDVGTQGHSQHGQGGGEGAASSGAPQSTRRHERPDSPHEEHADASGRGQRPDDSQREADEISRGSSDGTPPRGRQPGRR